MHRADPTRFSSPPLRYFFGIAEVPHTYVINQGEGSPP
jgi:hypothetical protein